jgi:hypothetical protein
MLDRTGGAAKQNRSVIQADEPHWGQGMMSRMECAP